MKILSMVIIFFVILIGCTFYKSFYDYSVIVKNNGERMIKDVQINSANGFWHETGYLSKAASKGIIGPQSVAPNSVYDIIIERKDQKASKHIIDLQDKIGKFFKGDIIFSIDDENNLSYELRTH